MLWLVTGGCGFIGRNLIRLLLARPDTAVRVVDDLSVGAREDLAAIRPVIEVNPGRSSARASAEAAPIELFVGDVRDETLARQAVAGVDVVVHLAANTGVGPSVADPRRDCLINVIGTLNYLEACRHGNVRRFVFASSGAPIGECEPPIHEELAAHPVSPYGASKLAGEAYCSAYKRSYGIDTVALRFGNCYGPYSSHKGSVVAKFIREALNGEAWEIYGDGRQTRDFVYVDDIADAIVRSGIVEAIGGETFQIATNTETTVSELAERLAAVLAGHQIRVAGIGNAEPRVGDVKRNYSDVRKARTRLGWRAQVELEEGLERTVRWFLKCAT
ncbi:MAG: NAD-dependent epimerase/dehydratase family protein [Stellaceae bacterium]